MPASTLKKIILCCLIIGLAGCGFKLRSAASLPPQLHTLYLQSHDPYGALTKQLQQTLLANGVKLVHAAHNAPYSLEITSDSVSQQTNNISATTQLVQYLLTYTVTYQIRDNHSNIVLGPRNITATRNYTANINQMLGESKERNFLLQDMQRDCIFQLLNQLSSVNTQHALQQAE